MTVAAEATVAATAAAAAAAAAATVEVAVTDVITTAAMAVVQAVTAVLVAAATVVALAVALTCHRTAVAVPVVLLALEAVATVPSVILVALEVVRRVAQVVAMAVTVATVATLELTEAVARSVLAVRVAMVVHLGPVHMGPVPTAPEEATADQAAALVVPDMTLEGRAASAANRATAATAAVLLMAASACQVEAVPLVMIKVADTATEAMRSKQPPEAVALVLPSKLAGTGLTLVFRQATALTPTVRQQQSVVQQALTVKTQRLATDKLRHPRTRDAGRQNNGLPMELSTAKTTAGTKILV